MGERKVINKYYPAGDFDPSKIPRRRRPPNGQIKVRTMLPMTLRCAACGEYLGRGTKFNARKEDAAGERYLGAIQVYRFYIRCPRCAAEIAFKTDPASSGYAVESGTTACRDGDGVRVGDETAVGKRRGRDGEEGGDAMESLEGRAREGKREMDADAALEEARSLSARRAGVTPEQLLESLNGNAGDGGKAQEELDQADEELVKSVGFRGFVTKRIEEEEDDDDEDFLEACLAKAVANLHAHKKQQGQDSTSSPLPDVCKRIRRMSVAADGKDSAPAAEAKASGGALQVLCCSYAMAATKRTADHLVPAWCRRPWTVTWCRRTCNVLHSVLRIRERFPSATKH